MSLWGRGFMWPNEWARDDGTSGWLSREETPDAEDALAVAAKELETPPDRLRLTPVLMREESEIEAKINGHEIPLWVECTTRAKKYEEFWRVETVAPEGEDGQDG